MAATKAVGRRRKPKNAAAPSRSKAAPSPEPVGGRGSMGEAQLEHFLWSIGRLGDYEEPYSAGKALTYSAVWACVSWIARSLATVEWCVYESLGEGQGKREVEAMEPTNAGTVSWLLNWETVPGINAVAWREAMAAEAVLRGNSYAWIDRDYQERVGQLVHLSADRVTPVRTAAGIKYHVKNGPGEPATALDARDVLHFRGAGPDPLIGYSVIELARRSVQLGMRQEQFGATYFKRGPMPGGIVELPANIKDEDRKQVRKDFERIYGGADNAGKVVVGGPGFKFSPLSMNNTDAQFLESRQFSVSEIARWFGVPPHKIGDLARSTNNNIEHQGIESVVDCLRPWARRMESEVDLKLFGAVNRGRYYTRHDFDQITRGDAQSHTESLARKVNAGILTVNEAREDIDKNPIEGGDTPLIQGAMVRLDVATAEPQAAAPAPPAAPAADPPPQGEPPVPAAMPDRIRRPIARMFAATAERLLRVEHDKATRASKQGRLSEWKAEFYADDGKAAAQFVPDVEAALALLESSADAKAAATALAAAHNQRGRTLRHSEIDQLADAGAAEAFADNAACYLWENRL